MSKDNRDFFKEKKDWSEIKDTLLGAYLKPYFDDKTSNFLCGLLFWKR